MPRLCIVYPDVCFTTEEKSRKIFSQGNRRALGCSAPNAIPLVDLVIAADGLDWIAAPCRPCLSRRVQASVSVSIRRVAVLGGSPLQETLSQSSESGY